MRQAWPFPHALRHTETGVYAFGVVVEVLAVDLFGVEAAQFVVAGASPIGSSVAGPSASRCSHRVVEAASAYG